MRKPDNRAAARRRRANAAEPQAAAGFESTDFGRRRVRWLPDALRSLGRFFAAPLQYLYRPARDADRTTADRGTRGGPPAGRDGPGL